MPNPAVQHQPPAVTLRDAAAQRQTQTQTAGQRGQPLRVEIAVKHHFHVLGVDAAAGIRHRQQYLPPFKPQGYGDGAALGREFQGVGQQVPDRLFQTDPVDRRTVVGGAALECQRHIPQGEQRRRLTAQTVQPRYDIGIFLGQRRIVQQHGRVGQVVGQAQQRIVVPVQQRRVPVQRRVRVPPFRRRQTADRDVHSTQRSPKLGGYMKQHLIEQPRLRDPVEPFGVRRLLRCMVISGGLYHICLPLRP